MTIWWSKSSSLCSLLVPRLIVNLSPDRGRQAFCARFTKNRELIVLKHPEIVLIINQDSLLVQEKHFIHVIHAEPDFKINSASQTQGMSPLFLSSTLAIITLKPELVLFTWIRCTCVQVLRGKTSSFFTQVIVKIHCCFTLILIYQRKLSLKKKEGCKCLYCLLFTTSRVKDVNEIS